MFEVLLQLLQVEYNMDVDIKNMCVAPKNKTATSLS